MDGFSFARPALARLDAQSDFALLLSTLRRDGVLVLQNAMAPDAMADIEADLDPWFQRSHNGEGSFFGKTTKRFSALPAKAASTSRLILHDYALALAEQVLRADDIGPARCDTIQLNLTQAISIGPGSPEQVVHRDQQLVPIDPGYELVVNVMWPIDRFTAENGGTWFVPGSCAWPRDRWPEPHEIVPAEADPGDAIIWLGSMMHCGGANRTSVARRGVVLSYNLGWLQPAERLLLSIPPDIARGLPERLQRLIGYQIHRPNTGWVECRDPIELLRGAAGAIAAPQDHLFPEQSAIIEGYYAARREVETAS